MNTGASAEPSRSRSSCSGDSPVAATRSCVEGKSRDEAVAVDGASSSSEVDATNHWPHRPAPRACGASPGELAKPMKDVGLAYSRRAMVWNIGSLEPTIWASTSPD